MDKPEGIIASAWVQSWDQHIGKDGAIAIMNALEAAGYKIVRKDMTDQMLDRLKTSASDYSARPAKR